MRLKGFLFVLLGLGVNFSSGCASEDEEVTCPATQTACGRLCIDTKAITVSGHVNLYGAVGAHDATDLGPVVVAVASPLEMRTVDGGPHVIAAAVAAPGGDGSFSIPNVDVSCQTGQEPLYLVLLDPPGTTSPNFTTTLYPLYLGQPQGDLVAPGGTALVVRASTTARLNSDLNLTGNMALPTWGGVLTLVLDANGHPLAGATVTASAFDPLVVSYPQLASASGTGTTTDASGSAFVMAKNPQLQEPYPALVTINVTGGSGTYAPIGAAIGTYSIAVAIAIPN
jgi:hypothetical protein